MLRAVAIQHNEDGKEHKTKFAPNFDFSKWARKMILNLKQQERAKVLLLMKELAETFEAAGQSFVETEPEKANLGDCMCHVPCRRVSCRCRTTARKLSTSHILHVLCSEGRGR